MLALLAGCSLPDQVVQRAPSGEILYQDDFSDPGSGWDRVVAPAGETDYAAGVYCIRVNEPYIDLWANPNLQFQDSRIQVEATKAGGPDDNVFGLVCRSDPAGEQYYFFVISSDGYYGIGKVSSSGQELLSAADMLPSGAIKQGKNTNLIQADCVGDRLALTVNGQLLAEVRDGELIDGDIGLTAGSFDKPAVEIHFDDLVVSKP
jgi:hypothetical protein